ncbi:MAG: hypothetical protein ACKOE4_00125, partial [Candidatus Kapaibacterium sp.]
MGIVHNAGQWPDTVLALFQAPGNVVWFTKNGVVRDAYGSNGGMRIGQVTFEHFADARLDLVTDDKEAVSLTYFKGNSGVPI